MPWTLAIGTRHVSCYDMGRDEALEFGRNLAIAGSWTVEALGPDGEVHTFDGEAILDELVRRDMER